MSAEMQPSNRSPRCSSHDNLHATTNFSAAVIQHEDRHVYQATCCHNTSLPPPPPSVDDHVSNSFRPRVSTMPSSSGCDELATWRRLRRPSVTTASPPCRITAAAEMYRVRSYSVTAKGVTKCGDALRVRHMLRQHSRSSSSGTGSSSSTFSLASGGGGATCTSPRHRSWSYGSSSSGYSEPTAVTSSYRVVVMGATGVGKSSLISQFVNFNFNDEAQGFDSQDQLTSTILLDGEESELQFSKFKVTTGMTLAEFEAMSDVDAYVIVYSVADRRSFCSTYRSLSLLQAGDLLQDKAAILVGNKIDLERCRCISTTEGREMATSCGCKFIETSDWMDHNVDELLVGILNQIRLKRQQSAQQAERKQSLHEARHRQRPRSRTLPPSSGLEVQLPNNRRSRSVVRDFFRRIHCSARSCDNLHIL